MLGWDGSWGRQGRLKSRDISFVYSLKVTNSNQFFSMSQPYICASLVEILVSLQKYSTDKPFLNILRPHVTLKV